MNREESAGMIDSVMEKQEGGMELWPMISKVY